MKSTIPGTLLLLAFTAGCAVASVDPDAEDPSAVGDGDGDGDGDDLSSVGGRGVVVSGTGGLSASGGAGSSGNSGGLSNSGGGLLDTGGTLNTGGTSSSSGGDSGGGDMGSGGSEPTDCIELSADDKESGSFESTSATCVLIDFTGQMNGWRANGAAGRTITINGTQVSDGSVDAINPGPLPLPGSNPYLVEFSAGDHAYCDFAFW